MSMVVVAAPLRLMSTIGKAGGAGATVGTSVDGLSVDPLARVGGVVDTMAAGTKICGWFRSPIVVPVNRPLTDMMDTFSELLTPVSVSPTSRLLNVRLGPVLVEAVRLSTTRRPAAPNTNVAPAPL